MSHYRYVHAQLAVLQFCQYNYECFFVLFSVLLKSPETFGNKSESLLVMGFVLGQVFACYRNGRYHPSLLTQHMHCSRRPVQSSSVLNWSVVHQRVVYYNSPFPNLSKCVKRRMHRIYVVVCTTNQRVPYGLASFHFIIMGHTVPCGECKFCQMNTETTHLGNNPTYPFFFYLFDLLFPPSSTA